MTEPDAICACVGKHICALPYNQDDLSQRVAIGDPNALHCACGAHMAHVPTESLLATPACSFTSVDGTSIPPCECGETKEHEHTNKCRSPYWPRLGNWRIPRGKPHVCECGESEPHKHQSGCSWNAMQEGENLVPPVPEWAPQASSCGCLADASLSMHLREGTCTWHVDFSNPEQSVFPYEAAASTVAAFEPRLDDVEGWVGVATGLKENQSTSNLVSAVPSTYTAHLRNVFINPAAAVDHLSLNLTNVLLKCSKKSNNAKEFQRMVEVWFLQMKKIMFEQGQPVSFENHETFHKWRGGVGGITVHRALETFYSTPDFTQGDSDRYPTPSALTAYNKMREELKLKEQQPMPAEELATLSRQHPANKNIHIADMTFCLFALALGPRWNEFIRACLVVSNKWSFFESFNLFHSKPRGLESVLVPTMKKLSELGQALTVKDLKAEYSDIRKDARFIRSINEFHSDSANTGAEEVEKLLCTALVRKACADIPSEYLATIKIPAYNEDATDIATHLYNIKRGVLKAKVAERRTKSPSKKKPNKKSLVEMAGNEKEVPQSREDDDDAPYWYGLQGNGGRTKKPHARPNSRMHNDAQKYAANKRAQNASRSMTTAESPKSDLLADVLSAVDDDMDDSALEDVDKQGQLEQQLDRDFVIFDISTEPNPPHCLGSRSAALFPAILVKDLLIGKNQNDAKFSVVVVTFEPQKIEVFRALQLHRALWDSPYHPRILGQTYDFKQQPSKTTLFECREYLHGAGLHVLLDAYNDYNTGYDAMRFREEVLKAKSQRVEQAYSTALTALQQAEANAQAAKAKTVVAKAAQAVTVAKTREQAAKAAVDAAKQKHSKGGGGGAGQDLSDTLRNTIAARARLPLLVLMARALREWHRLNICHRDVSARKFMIVSEHTVAMQADQGVMPHLDTADADSNRHRFTMVKSDSDDARHMPDGNPVTTIAFGTPIAMKEGLPVAKILGVVPNFRLVLLPSKHCEFMENASRHPLIKDHFGKLVMHEFLFWWDAKAWRQIVKRGVGGRRAPTNVETALSKEHSGNEDSDGDGDAAAPAGGSQRMDGAAAAANPGEPDLAPWTKLCHTLELDVFSLSMTMIQSMIAYPLELGIARKIKVATGEPGTGDYVAATFDTAKPMEPKHSLRAFAQHWNAWKEHTLTKKPEDVCVINFLRQAKFTTRESLALPKPGYEFYEPAYVAAAIEGIRVLRQACIRWSKTLLPMLQKSTSNMLDDLTRVKAPACALIVQILQKAETLAAVDTLPLMLAALKNQGLLEHATNSSGSCLLEAVHVSLHKQLKPDKKKLVMDQQIKACGAVSKFMTETVWNASVEEQTRREIVAGLKECSETLKNKLTAAPANKNKVWDEAIERLGEPHEWNTELMDMVLPWLTLRLRVNVRLVHNVLKEGTDDQVMVSDNLVGPYPKNGGTDLTEEDMDEDHGILPAEDLPWITLVREDAGHYMGAVPDDERKSSDALEKELNAEEMQLNKRLKEAIAKQPSVYDDERWEVPGAELSHEAHRLRVQYERFLNVIKKAVKENPAHFRPILEQRVKEYKANLDKRLDYIKKDFASVLDEDYTNPQALDLSPGAVRLSKVYFMWFTSNKILEDSNISALEEAIKAAQTEFNKRYNEEKTKNPSGCNERYEVPGAELSPSAHRLRVACERYRNAYRKAIKENRAYFRPMLEGYVSDLKTELDKMRTTMGESNPGVLNEDYTNALASDLSADAVLLANAHFDWMGWKEIWDSTNSNAAAESAGDADAMQME